jgi:hypothetical protein
MEAGGRRVAANSIHDEETAARREERGTNN